MQRTQKIYLWSGFWAAVMTGGFWWLANVYWAWDFPWWAFAIFWAALLGKIASEWMNDEIKTAKVDRLDDPAPTDDVSRRT